jgi:hypothetical protein
MQFFPGYGGVHLSARGRGRKRPTWVTEQNLSKNKQKTEIRHFSPNKFMNYIIAKKMEIEENQN